MNVKKNDNQNSNSEWLEDIDSRLPLDTQRSWTFLLSIIVRISNFFSFSGTDFLEGNRRSNRIKLFFWGYPFVVAVSALAPIFVSAIVLTDDLDESFVDLFRWSQISNSSKVFEFYLILFPLSLILLLYAVMFYISYAKFVAVFERSFVALERRNVVHAWGKFCVFLPQACALLVVVLHAIDFSGHGIFIFAAFCFFSSSVYALVLRTVVRQKVTELVKRAYLSPISDLRKARLRYIASQNIFSDVYSNWTTLNFVWGLVIFFLWYCFTKAGSWYKSISESGDGISTINELIFVGYAIVLVVAVVSVVGAMRQYTKLADTRYFCAAEIVQFEYNAIINEDNDYGEKSDKALNKTKMYLLETDPTVNIRGLTESTKTSYVSAFETTRPIQSLAFSLVVFLVSNDLPFSLATFFALAFAYASNDFIDFSSGKDQICHPNRALPSGRASKTAVARIILLSLLSAVAISGVFTLDYKAILFLLGGSLLYSGILKYRAPVVATPFWCFLIAAILSSAIDASWGLALGIWLVIIARELIIDWRDSEADAITLDSMSLAHHFGRRCPVISTYLFLCGGAVVFISGQPYAGIYLISMAICLHIYFSFQLRIREKDVAISNFGIFSHVVWPFALLLIS